MDGEPCPTCDGEGGWMDDGEPTTCDDCGGDGLQKENSVNDVPMLTEAELRATMEMCRKEMLDGRRHSAAPHAGVDWPSGLSAVCRLALAQLALIKDLTETRMVREESRLLLPAGQEVELLRAEVARRAAEVERLRAVLSGIRDMAENDLRDCAPEDGGSLWQIEADAAKAPGEEP